MKRLASCFIGVVIVCSLFSRPTCAEGHGPSPWAEAEISSAISLGFVPEELQGEYSKDLTRLEFVQLALEFLTVQYNYSSVNYFLHSVVHYDSNGKEVSTNLDVTFTDISNSDVEWARVFGIVQGRGDGIFDPDNTVTRQEAVTMLLRIYNIYCAEDSAQSIPVFSSFDDMSEIADWAVPAAEFMASLGIVEGTDAGAFNPNSHCTREECILFFFRLYQNAPTSRVNHNIVPLVSYEQEVKNVIGESIPVYQCETPDCTVVFRGYSGGSPHSSGWALYIVYASGGVKYFRNVYYENFRLSNDKKVLYFDDQENQLVLDIAEAIISSLGPLADQGRDTELS